MAGGIGETEPSWEEVNKGLTEIERRLERSVQQFEDSLSRRFTSQNKKERLGVSKNEVSKSLYEVFGFGRVKSTVIDQHTSGHEENKNLSSYGGPKDEYLHASTIEEHVTRPDGYKIEEEVEKGEHVDLVDGKLDNELTVRDEDVHEELALGLSFEFSDTSTVDGLIEDRPCGELELIHSSSPTTGVPTFMTGEIHAERHDSERIDSGGGAMDGGYDSPLVEGPWMAPLGVADVLMGDMLQGSSDSDIDTHRAFRDEYSRDVWDPGLDDTSRVSTQEDMTTHTGYRTVVAHESRSATHGLGAQLPVMIQQEEHSESSVTEERPNIEDLDPDTWDWLTIIIPVLKSHLLVDGRIQDD